ncbi:QRFP-like peptide receptor [Amia ocellicauda]|uniref:QRFP-like peptide receptor n=1 Tax=Amia ocellicauda TaxID=2972642 RepID=UPI0034648091
MNFTPEMLNFWLDASNLSRQQFIQQFGLQPLVYVPRLPPALQPIFGILYVVIFILALGGNTVVMVLLCRRKALQSPTTFFVCSLALSDLLISIFCIPTTFLQHFFTNWLAGQFLCKLVAFLQVTAVSTSILTMTCIAVERFQGILYPLQLRKVYSPCHAIKMLAAVWLAAVVIASPMWYAHEVEVMYDFLFDVHYTCCQEVWPHSQQRQAYTTFLLVLVFLVPMITMGVLYGRIIRELWGKHRVHDIMFQALPGSEINKITRKKRHAVKLMAIVVLLFAICWMPFHLVSLLSDYGKLNLGSDQEFVVFTTVQLLGFSNSVCNPVVYAVLNENFKKGLLAILQQRRRQRWPGPRLGGRARVGISAVEMLRLREHTEQGMLGAQAHQWSRVAWESEPHNFNSLPQVHLFRGVSKQNSSPLLVSVTDPLHTTTSSN